MMLVLLLYSYCVGVFSSRKIMGRCETDVAFRVIVGEDIPDFRRIAEFRRRHLERMQLLFVEVLSLCREAGLLKVGRLALDGTKIKANASRHKAMSYDRMTSEEERLQKEIDELLAQAQDADEAEDEQHGIDPRGDELPEALHRRETRLRRFAKPKRRWKNRLGRRRPSTPRSWKPKAARRATIPMKRFPSRRINGTSPILNRRS